MKEKFYQISKGSLYYLNLLWESVSDELKVDIEYASRMIEEELMSIDISKKDHKTLRFDASTIEESELIRMTLLRLQFLVVYSGHTNVKNLISYIMSNRNKTVLGEKEVNRS
ncbi:MAG: hypothetical protein NC483_02145 [Ruminococcus sp.]|nr:hypothetical protein [Ruminococcus sp.]